VVGLGVNYDGLGGVMGDDIISCSNGHSQIIFSKTNYTNCPLCALTKHNNEVHDFIESNNYTNELVQYLKEIAIKKGE
jgi:hypothetical protein